MDGMTPPKLTDEQLIAEAYQWRAQLAAVGGWQNELVSIPAGGVREIINNCEAIADRFESLLQERALVDKTPNQQGSPVDKSANSQGQPAQDDLAHRLRANADLYGTGQGWTNQAKLERASATRLAALAAELAEAKARLHECAEVRDDWWAECTKLRAQLDGVERDAARRAYERSASLISTGKFCRHIEHCQGYCDCGEMATAIRALASPAEGK